MGSWQLYTFCVVQICFSLGTYGLLGDPCRLLTGRDEPCRAGAETFVFRSLAFGCLYVAVVFAVLTRSNKESAPKLKRLAMFATNCVVMMIAALVFTGSRTLGGTERGWLHFADMITLFALMVVTISAMADDSEVSGSKSPLAGLGINPKAFIFLAAIATFVKFFALSDFVHYSSFLSDPDSTTDLSDAMWPWMTIVVFEVLFALVFTLAYGVEKDQEAITYSIVALTVIGFVSMIPIMDQFAEGMMKTMIVSGCVLIGVAIAAVIGGRCGRRHDYDTISAVV